MDNNFDRLQCIQLFQKYRLHRHSLLLEFIVGGFTVGIVTVGTVTFIVIGLILIFGGVITGGLKSGVSKFVPCGADNGDALSIVLGVIEAFSCICAAVVVTGLLLANP